MEFLWLNKNESYQTRWMNMPRTPNIQGFYIGKKHASEKERGYEPLLRPPGGGGFLRSTGNTSWLCSSHLVDGISNRTLL
nr:hypothetical protein Q903MT_gene5226 [Picea sitchensis]